MGAEFGALLELFSDFLGEADDLAGADHVVGDRGEGCIFIALGPGGHGRRDLVGEAVAREHAMVEDAHPVHVVVDNATRRDPAAFVLGGAVKDRYLSEWRDGDLLVRVVALGGAVPEFLGE